MRGSSGSGTGWDGSSTTAIRRQQNQAGATITVGSKESDRSYCRERKIHFLHDEMNDDERFARVRIRKRLMPLMQSFNNRVVEALSRTASLLQEDT